MSHETYENSGNYRKSFFFANGDLFISAIKSFYSTIFMKETALTCLKSDFF